MVPLATSYSHARLKYVPSPAAYRRRISRTSASVSFDIPWRSPGGAPRLPNWSPRSLHQGVHVLGRPRATGEPQTDRVDTQVRMSRDVRRVDGHIAREQAEQDGTGRPDRAPAYVTEAELTTEQARTDGYPPGELERHRVVRLGASLDGLSNAATGDDPCCPRAVGTVWMVNATYAVHGGFEGEGIHGGESNAL